ncbi:MAG: tRNA lysidine(34) synthetase TilS [Cytophagaceae bacterium]|nr:tRNA lysidine(34) synthetase TilS [Gemmatimonadaceae bacterium]
MASTDPFHPIERLLGKHERVLLAVSGGLDSMCLLKLAAERIPPKKCNVSVATFDHGSGEHASRAAAFVSEHATAAGLRVHVGKATGLEPTEAAWREARWKFLRERASIQDAVIVTAHTADDQLETVVMRILRGSGARGLAGLLAPSPGIERPLVRVSRRDLAQLATERGIEWIEDPTNEDPRFFRNRVRHDLLPAMRAVDPSLLAEFQQIGEHAAEIRRTVDRITMRWEQSRSGRTLTVDGSLLVQLGRQERALAWQSILHRNGIVLDKRGISGLADMNEQTQTGYRLQVSGGIEAMRTRDAVVLQPLVRHSCSAVALTGPSSTNFGAWVFRLGNEERGPDVEGEPQPWETWVPADAALLVREWTPGDRLQGGPDRLARRVARFLADVGIPGPTRRGWPVVVADGEIIWVPGVRRDFAAAARSGRPVRRLVCERPTG